ncbi:MAG: glycoside hydrolase family 97 catalytic domain-containing protein [Marinifilaceae bacterium]
MRTTILLFTLLFIHIVGTCQSKEKKLTFYSPNKRIAFELFTANDSLSYRISQQGTTVVLNSSFLWKIGPNYLGDNVDYLEVTEARKDKSKYQLWGSDTFIQNINNSSLIKVYCNNGLHFLVELCMYNDGVAFRYIGELSNEEEEINDFTTFTIPQNSSVWMQADTKYYEGAYREINSDQMPHDKIMGPPITYKCADNVYVSITEGGLLDFGGMGLQCNGTNTLTACISGKTLLKGQIQTPWRVVMIGNLNSLVNNQIINHVSPPLSEAFRNNVDWIIPGGCVWSWLAGYSVTPKNMKLFADWASKLQIPYNLIDEGWSHWGKDEEESWSILKDVVDYSAAKGVKTMIWKAYPDRKQIAGVQTAEKRSAFFQKCKEIGVVGVKLDFFDAEDQSIIKYYKETLEDAAKYQIMVNFHGSNKPTGLNRTYPNEVTREGIHGLEYGCAYADQNTVTPFTRYLAGHADYTPFTFRKNMMGATSICHQIATLVLFNSPLMCYGGNPEDYLQHPTWDFVKDIPTIWDETIVLPPSEIGETAVMARRKGNDWYVGGIFCKETSDLTIPLSFLKKGKYNATIIQDKKDNQFDYFIENKNVVNNKDYINLYARASGGFVIKLESI